MKILIVEAGTPSGRFYKEIFESQGFSVDISELEDFSINLIYKLDPDLLLISDAVSGVMVMEVCTDVRLAEGVSPYILIVSSSKDVHAKIDLLNAGADDHLLRPFSSEELLARVRALLRRPRCVISDVVRIGDLVIDTRKQQVEKDGRNIYLTRKEFLLLEYLVRNKGDVLTRDMILGHVWDINADLFSNTIETHVLNLRKKIDCNNRSCLIKTVPGRGYKIDEK